MGTSICCRLGSAHFHDSEPWRGARVCDSYIVAIPGNTAVIQGIVFCIAAWLGMDDCDHAVLAGAWPVRQ